MKTLCSIRSLTSLISVAVLCTACSSDDGDDAPAITPEYAAIIASVSPLFDGSQIEIVDLEQPTLEAVAGFADSDQSDIDVDSYGSNFYRIGRFDIDNVTKYAVNDPDTIVWQYATVNSGATSTSNPYDLVFVSETKAYLLRYNSNIAWIVNPSASSAEEFKIGELDLSTYDDGDGTPEMVNGVIVDNRLYIVMQRLNFWSPTETAYIAVFDTSSDTEIDTAVDTENSLKGIPLITRNPQRITYSSEIGLIVQSSGDYYNTFNNPDAYSGGIEKIELSDHSTSLILDDGDANDHPYESITNMAIASSTNGYFVSYAGWEDTSLYQFNPSTGDVTGSVTDISNVDIRDITISPDGKLWVSIADAANPRILLVNTDSNMVETTITTLMNPTNVVFTQKN